MTRYNVKILSPIIFTLGWMQFGAAIFILLALNITGAIQLHKYRGKILKDATNETQHAIRNIFFNETTFRADAMRVALKCCDDNDDRTCLQIVVISNRLFVALKVN